MAPCARCLVQDMMNKYGPENIIEGRRLNVFDIYRRVELGEVDSDRIVAIHGELYVWTMGLYSLKHSADEDCTGRLDSGFPKFFYE